MQEYGSSVFSAGVVHTEHLAPPGFPAGVSVNTV